MGAKESQKCYKILIKQYRVIFISEIIKIELIMIVCENLRIENFFVSKYDYTLFDWLLFLA